MHFNLEFIFISEYFLEASKAKIFAFSEARMFSSEILNSRNVEKYFKIWIVVGSKFLFRSSLGIRSLNVYISYENDDLVMKCMTTVHP